eukprot:1584379-Amphidinium_carterae.1
MTLGLRDFSSTQYNDAPMSLAGTFLKPTVHSGATPSVKQAYDSADIAPAVVATNYAAIVAMMANKKWGTFQRADRNASSPVRGVLRGYFAKAQFSDEDRLARIAGYRTVRMSAIEAYSGPTPPTSLLRCVHGRLTAPMQAGWDARYHRGAMSAGNYNGVPSNWRATLAPYTHSPTTQRVLAFFTDIKPVPGIDIMLAMPVYWNIPPEAPVDL